MENQTHSHILMHLPADVREKIIAALTGRDSAFIDIARLRADLRIHALNRVGDYACVLVPKKNRGAQWDKFVESGKAFGILPNQFEYFLKHHDALHATL